MHHVIIGNGIAGVSAAEAIRELDGRAAVTMISDEDLVPYSRPMISMVLDGSAPLERLAIRPANFYARARITPLLGERVRAMDLDAQRVCVGDDHWVPYDRLLIASGADARPWRVPGADLNHVFYMRTQKDIQRSLAALAGARQALVLGGGLVGFKAAYGLLRRGLAVTMLITSDYPLSQQVDPTAGAIILEEMRAHGLKVEVGRSVEAFAGNGRVAEAQVSDGGRIACDLAVVGKGVMPALDFVPRNRINVDLGIVVDDGLRTSAPNVYAAGDAVEATDIARRTRWVNAIWPEAAVQGRLAGFNMAGRPVSYRGSLSRNVMRIYDLDLMVMGLVNPPDGEGYQVLTRHTPRNRQYRRLVFKNDRLAGAVLVNGIEQGGLLLSLIQNRTPIALPKTHLLRSGFNFGCLLSGAPLR